MAREPRSRRFRRPLLIMALVLGVWAVWLGAHLVLARADLLDGLQAADAAREKTQLVDLAEGRALPELRQASEHFERAHRRVTGPTWFPVRLLPVVGRQLRSVSALSSAAGEVADTGVDGISELQQLLQSDTRPERRVELVRQLSDVAGRTERRLAGLGLGPSQALLPELARRRNQLETDVEELRAGLARGSQGARAVADLLAGPRRYLVFAANNAEMRAGAGMFLSVGELQTGGGDLQLGEMLSVGFTEVPPGAVPPAGDADLFARWGWLKPNQDWRNLMVSPRFDVSAALAARMWEAVGRSPVDGVLSVDPVALQAIVEATGPVTVEDRTIGPDEVVEELTHEQYLRFPEQVEERREELGAIAEAAFSALDSKDVPVTTLASGLARAVRGRHLLAWSARPEEQQLWQDTGAAGTLTSDSLLLSILNRGGNKLDRFLDVSAQLDYETVGPDTEFALRVTIANRTGPDEPTYVAGPNPEAGLQPGEYLGILTANLPAAAAGGRIEGVDELAVAGTDGPTRVVGFQLSVLRGESRTLVVRFRLPGQSGDLRVEPSARVPPVRWSGPTGPWNDGESHRFTWRGGG